MEKQRMITLKSMVNGIVCINKPELAIKRKWNKRGQAMALPYELVEQLLWDNGFRSMIDSGILYIENMQDKIDLGIEPEGATEPQNVIILDDDKMENLWKNIPISVFKREISDLSSIQLEALVQYAIKHDIADSAKCIFIKELTGKDILVSISRKQDAIKEAEREEARRKANEEEGRRG